MLSPLFPFRNQGLCRSRGLPSPFTNNTLTSEIRKNIFLL